MPWWAWALIVWGVVAPPVALLIGKMIKTADERRGYVLIRNEEDW